MALRRKLFAFVMTWALCGVGVYIQKGISWPIAALAAWNIAFFCTAISVEKISLAFIDKVKSKLMEKILK